MARSILSLFPATCDCNHGHASDDSDRRYDEIGKQIMRFAGPLNFKEYEVTVEPGNDSNEKQESGSSKKSH